MRRRQPSASGLGGVCAVSGRSHAGGVPADAGHEEPDLAQIFFQGADAGHILAVGGLIDQLVVDLLAGAPLSVSFFSQPMMKSGEKLCIRRRAASRSWSVRVAAR